ncbi:DUF2974 domain-containing protein [Luteimonas huabeiensis]|uniref:DUF2974 domain-containing protein n=1 Tax=Luteimonas huabeiensis TaxID=1244513 RepID=UPI0004644579|nr:DUF2974 domain-containing protein [Luteimonas huabeiensis]
MTVHLDNASILQRYQLPPHLLQPVQGQPAQAPQVPFADQVRGQDPQPGIDKDLALLSQDVYQTDASGPIGAAGWTRVEHLPPGITTPLQSDASGFQAQIYTDGNGNYALAFAGTEFTSGADWLANLGQGLGFETAQYRDAMALAQEASAEWGDNLVITGHSLGGGLASAASLATGNPAVTFNAAGLSDQTLRDLGFTPNGARELAADGQVRRYTVENDILTAVQQNGSPLPDALGHQLQLENTHFIKDPIRAHMMDAVLNGLDAGDPTVVERTPLDRAIERPGEAALDLAGNALREGGGLIADTLGDGGELLADLGDSGRDLLDGRPIDAVAGGVGDTVEFALQGSGNLANRTLSLAGDTVNAAGNLAGGLVRDLGELVGLKDAGNTAGGWIENGTQWLGDGLDTLGGWAESGLDTVGGWASDGLNTAGEWAQDRWNDFKASNWNPGNWF